MPCTPIRNLFVTFAPSAAPAPSEARPPAAPARPASLAFAVLACALACASPGPALARPTLAPGVWTDITPAAPKVDPATNVFCQGMALDPSNPDVIYLCVCGYDVTKPVGLYKSVDGGSTWARVGALDEPVHVTVDPKDPLHLYAVDGVRGNTQGFWVSRDGGRTWDKPAGFVQASADPVGTQDLYSLSTEPGNFDHVLISYHSPWKNGIGNARTWLFTAQQGGFFRTTDGSVARAPRPALVPWQGGVAATRGTGMRYTLPGRRLPDRR